MIIDKLKECLEKKIDVWESYEICKKEIDKLQKEKLFCSNREYEELIALITELLGI